MKTMWKIAIIEFTIQRRGLVFWLSVIILCLWMYGEVLQGISGDAGLASGQNSLLVEVYGTEAQETMKLARYSLFQAWGISDQLGLLAALFISVPAAFVWQRDQRLAMMETVSTRSFQSWQYVLGKYLGVVCSWGVIVIPLAGIGIAWTYLEGNQYGLTVSLADFLFPVIGWTLLSLIYGTAFTMLIGLIVRNGTATLMIYLAYWAYCLTDVRMLRGASTTKLFTYWLIRSGYAITRENLGIVQNRFAELWWNRCLYLSLTVLTLYLTVWAFDVFRRRGTLIGSGGDAD